MVDERYRNIKKQSCAFIELELKDSSEDIELNSNTLFEIEVLNT